MRNHLHRAAQKVPAALAGNDFGIDLTAGHIGMSPQLHIGKALIVAKVEVGLGAVLEDEHLTVLQGGHGAGVDIDVGIELLEGHAHAA